MNNVFGISFTICSFLFFLFLIVVYFRKNAKYNLRNLVYRRILYFGFFGFLFEFLFFLALYYSNSASLISIIKKFSFLCFLACMILWTYYVLILAFEKNREASSWIRKRSDLFDIYMLAVLIFLGIVEFLMPVSFSYTDSGNIQYVHGAASIFMYVFFVILAVLPIPFLFVNHETVTFKRFFSYYFILVLIIASVIVICFIPGMSLIGFIYTFCCYLVYYRLENPDIYFVRKFKQNSDRMKYLREQFGFLFNMSPELRSMLNEISYMKENYMNDGRKTIHKKKLETLINDFVKSSEEGKTHQTKVDDDGIEILDLDESPPDEMLLTKEIYSLNELKDVLKEDNLPKW